MVSSLSCLSLACSSARCPAGPLPTPRCICGCAGHPQSPSPTAPAAPDLEQAPMPSTCFLTLRLPRAVRVSCVCVCTPWLLRCGQVGMGTYSTLHGQPSLGPQVRKGRAPVGTPDTQPSAWSEEMETEEAPGLSWLLCGQGRVSSVFCSTWCSTFCLKLGFHSAPFPHSLKKKQQRRFVPPFSKHL